MDDIQRKLALIDKQLAAPPLANFHKQIISTAPLLFVATGLIAGILTQNRLGLSIHLWLILLILSSATTILFFAIQRSSSTNYQYATAYLALACFACLGAIRLSSFHQPGPNDIRHLVGAERRLATIRGRVTTKPQRENRDRWQFGKFKPTDTSSSFYLKVKQVKTTEGWAKAAGTVRVQVDEWVRDLKVGDYIQTYCWLDRFKQATNPGQFDTAKYLARKNIFIAASVKSRDGISNIKYRTRNNELFFGDVFTKIKRKARETATQALAEDLSLQESNRGLLEALLLGYRANIDSGTYSVFRKTGLLHFISLSGMHLGILVGLIWWVCRLAGLMKPARATICIIAIGIFLLIVPLRAPTLRAAIICWAFCISFFFRRHSNPLNTLSLAAIILLLIRPTQLFEAGWQLSFASVLGILVFTEKIENFLHERTGDWFRNIALADSKYPMRPAKRLGKTVITLFSVGLAAWLGGAGILLYHFYTITPLTSIWTVIVFPLVALILIIGYLKIILVFLLPSVAAVLGVIVSGVSDLLIWVVKFIASLDISQILIGHVSPASVILYYCLILFAGFAYFRRPLIKKAIYTVMALVIIVFLGAARWQRTNRDNLAITCLDVSHGQAILIQLPGKANVLFDTGSLHKNDIGRRIVIPFLNYSGIDKVDAIIISHNDIDHINGIPEIVEDSGVNAVYANDAFFDKADKWGTAKFLKTLLSESGFEIQRLEKDLNLSSSASIRILWPSEQACQDEQLGDNDKSLVCLIEFAGRKILLCSDIEKFAQRELLRLFPNLKADIVVVPHHGSVKTLDADFLENLKADILIYSCSRRQYERQQTITQTNKAESFYTARDGAITVYIGKDGTITSKCIDARMSK